MRNTMEQLEAAALKVTRWAAAGLHSNDRHVENCIKYLSSVE